MEHNRDQIIKALECCCGDIVECQKCAYVKNGYNRCKERASQDALALINSQEQKIKELTEKNERLRATRYFAHPDGRIEIIPTAETVKADTVRKMQERINAHFDSDSDYFRSSHGYIRNVVDQIAKEMLEGKE